MRSRVKRGSASKLAPLDQPAPFEATWEIRFGVRNEFRALYEVDEAEKVVYVLAIGVKDDNRLIVGDEEFET